MKNRLFIAFVCVASFSILVPVLQAQAAGTIPDGALCSLDSQCISQQCVITSSGYTTGHCAPSTSQAPTCDPAVTSCQAGTIAPDGSVNTGTESDTTQSATCDPAIASCEQGTIAPDGSVNRGTDGSTNPPGGGGGGSNTTPPGSDGGSNTSNPGGTITLINPLGSSGATLEGFLNSILDFVIRIGTIVVILMLVYIGFLFVTSRGEPGKITQAREALLWTVVGALILVGSKAIAVGIEATVRALSVGN